MIEIKILNTAITTRTYRNIYENLGSYNDIPNITNIIEVIISKILNFIHYFYYYFQDIALKNKLGRFRTVCMITF